MFDPDAGMPRLNRSLVYFDACIIAGLRLARERQVNVRGIPTGRAIEESVDLAHEIFNALFWKVPEKLNGRPDGMCGRYGRRSDKQLIAEWMQAHFTNVSADSHLESSFNVAPQSFKCIREPYVWSAA